jgi:transposase-like protein
MKCPSCAANAEFSKHESSPTIQIYRCKCGYRLAVKTGWGKAAEFSGLLLVAVSILRVVIDHHGFLDFLDDGS